jgi:hypothetical protein
MTFVLVLLAALCLYRVKRAPAGGFFEDYLSRGKTQAIKGIFVVLVFLRHFEQYVVLEGTPHKLFLIVNKYSSQLIVAMFLFYSGYGVASAIRAKGMDYVHAIPKKKILKLLLRFDIVVLAYLFVSALLGCTYRIPTIIGAFFGWESVGNSSWYVFAILMAYLCTFIGFALSRGDGKKGRAVTTVCILLYCIVVSRYKTDAPRYYNTMLCYIMGMYYEAVHGQIEQAFFQKKSRYIGACAAAIAGFALFSAGYFKTEWMVLYMLATAIFSLLIILFTMRVGIDNRPLEILGDYVFEVYILQRLSMMVFAKVSPIAGNVYLYLIVCAVGTAVLSVAYRKMIREVALLR